MRAILREPCTTSRPGELVFGVPGAGCRTPPARVSAVREAVCRRLSRARACACLSLPLSPSPPLSLSFSLSAFLSSDCRTTPGGVSAAPEAVCWPRSLSLSLISLLLARSLPPSRSASPPPPLFRLPTNTRRGQWMVGVTGVTRS